MKLNYELITHRVMKNQAELSAQKMVSKNKRKFDCSSPRGLKHT
jgi:hypothetical protein